MSAAMSRATRGKPVKFFDVCPPGLSGTKLYIHYKLFNPTNKTYLRITGE